MKQITRSRKMPNCGKIPQSHQGAWIGYQMRINGLTDQLIASTTGVSRQMVQRVRYGLKTSARVQKAIANALGYDSWSELAAVCKGVAA